MQPRCVVCGIDQSDHDEADHEFVMPEARSGGDFVTPQNELSIFDFVVTGTEESSGSLVREFEQRGEIKADLMGEALEQLIGCELWWDTLDTSLPITIEIRERNATDG